MITCPTCGRPVAENQRFCGNCGTDVQAALAYRAASQNPPVSPAPLPPTAPTYSYDPGSYISAPVIQRRLSPTMVALIILGVGTLCLCCGLVFGGAFVYWFFPTQSLPAPTPTPTPAALNLFINILKV